MPVVATVYPFRSAVRRTVVRARSSVGVECRCGPGVHPDGRAWTCGRPARRSRRAGRGSSGLPGGGDGDRVGGPVGHPADVEGGAPGVVAGEAVGDAPAAAGADADPDEVPVRLADGEGADALPQDREGVGRGWGSRSGAGCRRSRPGRRSRGGRLGGDVAPDELVYVDSLLSTLYIEEPGEVFKYSNLFRRALAESLPRKESIALIKRMAKGGCGDE
ncbi:Scr1 family TA system antitoxin-like transcriptional regulator [Kitasatospora sp. NPDC005856]|uniref:Scr1 family TA system antitoxin-like transcriptional regulator n=1 Tax=Kitasatospora sp. NPDC005856 TaxID=3154566 RepID=UPI0033D45477